MLSSHYRLVPRSISSQPSIVLQVRLHCSSLRKPQSPHQKSTPHWLSSALIVNGGPVAGPASTQSLWSTESGLIDLRNFFELQALIAYTLSAQSSSFTGITRIKSVFAKLSVSITWHLTGSEKCSSSCELSQYSTKKRGGG